MSHRPRLAQRLAVAGLSFIAIDSCEPLVVFPALARLTREVALPVALPDFRFFLAGLMTGESLAARADGAGGETALDR